MSHSISTTGQKGELSYLRGLWSVLLAPERDLWSKLEQLFGEEAGEFGLEYGFFSRIDRDAGTQQFEIVHGDHEHLAAGNTVPLSETYCRKTIAEPCGTMAVSDALTEGWGDDSAYHTFGLGSYLGTTVTLEGDLYGTLCFASSSARRDPITDPEVALLELYGQWLSCELNQWTGPPAQNHPRSNLQEPTRLPSPRIDSMLDALSNDTRRSILLALLHEGPGTILDVSERSTDTDEAIQLCHTHLPKLDGDGYVEWDRDANTVSRGPQFHHIEPFLRFLEEYFAGDPRRK
jgi:hypothetical protein